MEDLNILKECGLKFELESIQVDIEKTDASIAELQARKSSLLEKKQKLIDKALLYKSQKLSKKDWVLQRFPWSDKVDDLLLNKFKLTGFRPQQLSTINAYLSKQDALLIMPTGGGKSLCYQLPAMVTSGLTLVITPLVSLMEDQVISLRKYNIVAKLLNSNIPRETTNATIKEMVDNKSEMRLLYVTPERLSKSKRFMSVLQKCYNMNRLDRIAIDEVHCCSQWGHDFRPDYKFLGVLRAMFVGVPILGLTATATSRVIIDTQKMLDIEGCLVIKSSFNRPNLFYQVLQKPAEQGECFDLIESLLKHRYAGQTGIIYTTTIKQAEVFAKELKSRGLKVGCYHADMEPEPRSNVHKKWLSQEIQAIVATIAFGMGIDKPDVRFVIHHCISKSLENFYQESGRAGRDGKRAECILLYRLGDIFKLSPMVFTSKTGLETLYSIAEYCLDSQRCRRQIIASHFEEGWDDTHCMKMCDNCSRSNRNITERNIVQHCKDLLDIIDHFTRLKTKLTSKQLVDSWLQKGTKNLRIASKKPPDLHRDQAEDIVAHLLTKGFLKEDFHFTSYSTISYLKRGPSAFKQTSMSEIKFVIPRRTSLNTKDKFTFDCEEKWCSSKVSPVESKSPITKAVKRKINDIVLGTEENEQSSSALVCVSSDDDEVLLSSFKKNGIKRKGDLDVKVEESNKKSKTEFES